MGIYFSRLTNCHYIKLTYLYTITVYSKFHTYISLIPCHIMSNNLHFIDIYITHCTHSSHMRQRHFVYRIFAAIRRVFETWILWAKLGGRLVGRGTKNVRFVRIFFIEFSFFISCPEPSISAQCNRSTVFNWPWH
jgi:hypothetical protein